MQGRTTLAALLLTLATGAWAQQPQKLEPLPDVPPPPNTLDVESKEPPVVVTTRKKGEDTIEEYRVNGQLYMIKVIPPEAPPYYLVDPDGKGQFVRRDGHDTGLQVPMWLIKSW
jgi:Protein of unknown function (DUF2782)